MSDVTVRSTASVPRIELRKAFGGDPRLIKAFENLFEDVASILPGAVGANADAIAVAEDAAESALSAANLFGSIAAAAFAAALDANLEPGNGALMAEISALRSRVDALEQGITA